jgi:hypothetical protein
MFRGLRLLAIVLIAIAAIAPEPFSPRLRILAAGLGVWLLASWPEV